MSDHASPAAIHRVLVITPGLESVHLLSEVAADAKAGLEFDHCIDCSEAARYWRTMPKLPDLIIWSVEAGAGAAQKFSDLLEEDILRRPIPLLIWAMHYSKYEWDRLISMGAWDCMVKPFDLSEHLACLDVLLKWISSPKKYRGTASLGIFQSVRY